MAKEIIREHGQAFIGGLSRVFHCNHYNAYLQMAVMLSDGIAGCNPKKLLTEAVIPLVKHLRNNGYSEKELTEEFAFCGFGKLRAMLNDVWVTPTSHYGQAAIMHGKKEPSCFFTAGYISGITDRETREDKCKQQGAPVDWFKSYGELEPPENPLKFPPEYKNTPPRFSFQGCQDFNTDIDEDAIIEAVSGLPLYGKSGTDDTGLIDAFGVVLTNHFADYYNYISYQTYFKMVESGMPLTHTRDVFIQGGHICAFNTFGGIMSSPEWYQLVAPHCQSDADWIHGMVAVINALGWGTWRVEQIDPGNQLVIRIYNSYEGVGYRRIYPQSEEVQLSFLNMGAAQGLAHLLWKIDIKERPALDHEFYTNVFNNPENRFGVKQTHAIAAGHDFDRIVVQRN
jgi:predicted hydrocarbon binding protein